MIITAGSVDLHFSARIIEPDINREASKFIQDNYTELLTYINKQGIIDKASDLLHDVYISVQEDEDNGEGYDSTYGLEEGTEFDPQNKSKVISVSKFIYGRVKMYCKNVKYSSSFVEKSRIKVLEHEVVYEDVYDSDGNKVLNANGQPKQHKVTKVNKSAISVITSAASADMGNDDLSESSNDEFQVAYSMAVVEDSANDIASLLSLREEIDYCIDVGDMHSVKILGMFKNMDTLASILADSKRRRLKCADPLFGVITELTKYHADFAESLLSVLTYAEKNRSAFDSIIATY